MSNLTVRFLHIPKTAGQSVHQYLVDIFGEEAVFPMRVNEQIKCLSLNDMQGYRVYSGHFDWIALDFIRDPMFTFTILRDPLERILSFYFYLRNKAISTKEEELKKPENQGLYAALTMTPDEYFCEQNGSFNTFINNHYNNFYVYYFAGRSYESWSKLSGAGKCKNQSYLLDLALNNISELDAVYHINTWENGLMQDLNHRLDKPVQNKVSKVVNKGDGKSAQERIDSLISIGPSGYAMEKINEFCELDKKLMNIIFNK